MKTKILWVSFMSLIIPVFASSQSTQYIKVEANYNSSTKNVVLSFKNSSPEPILLINADQFNFFTASMITIEFLNYNNSVVYTSPPISIGTVDEMTSKVYIPIGGTKAFAYNIKTHTNIPVNLFSQSTKIKITIYVNGRTISNNTTRFEDESVYVFNK